MCSSRARSDAPTCPGGTDPSCWSPSAAWSGTCPALPPVLAGRCRSAGLRGPRLRRRADRAPAHAARADRRARAAPAPLEPGQPDHPRRVPGRAAGSSARPRRPPGTGRARAHRGQPPARVRLRPPGHARGDGRRPPPGGPLGRPGRRALRPGAPAARRRRRRLRGRRHPGARPGLLHAHRVRVHQRRARGAERRGRRGSLRRPRRGPGRAGHARGGVRGRRGAHAARRLRAARRRGADRAVRGPGRGGRARAGVRSPARGPPGRPAGRDGAGGTLAQGPAQAGRPSGRPPGGDPRRRWGPAARHGQLRAGAGGGQDAGGRRPATTARGRLAPNERDARPSTNGPASMKPPRANGYRDAWCGGFSAGDTDAPARVAGWVHRRRDHGGVVFIDRRDRSGLRQLVFHPHRAPEAHQPAHRLPPQDGLIAAMRAYLAERDFLEVETPILTRSTPEGARDFLVPARISPGTFFALPQSPQLFKQLLMIAGAERYYQIARCFRDEDSRADRQPEFTQLDIEMSFVEEDDVIELIEGLMHRVLSVGGLGLPAPPWPRLPHAEAMERYGSDRPDLRFGMEIHDVSELVQGSDFKVFENVLGSGAGVVRALNAGPQGAAMSRHELDELNEFVQAYGARATAPMPVTEEGWGSNLAKFFSPEQVAAVNQRLGASPGDLLLFVADRASVAAAALGALRLELGHRFGLVPAGRHQVSWVVDFPMFEYDEAEGRWDPLHHPFTQPTGDLADPGALRARADDLTIDGWEMGGGSIRIHSPEVQREVFRAIGISDQEAQERFGFLLDALRYGAPPHGGIAFRIDRIVALLGGRESIRDAIAFPKTASGLDPLTGAPAAVDERQLRELGVRLAGGAPRTGDAGTR